MNCVKFLVPLIVMFFLVVVSTSAQDGSGSMATPTTDLPPRPSPRPAVTPTTLGGGTSPVYSRATDENKSDTDRFSLPQSVSEIRLVGMQTASWVEWQDAQGDWHLVEGWRAENGGDIVWYVSSAHAGTGPYRAREADGWTSPPFFLNGDIDLSLNGGEVPPKPPPDIDK